ncbi:hypothetical protein B0T26DRAFT_856727 [Lasiosphaeria miniovina]|uniref:Uncharacterized protein n=1 Tax=Lasiosphaeria miniovina TaxID=1954250 RepID=A0AA40AB47_9PEZI|nr:uncharacterized protein B0T26DRAFT_856727 [Lasiosphaeria miniovina]KAK0712569.1 hypothetical protein B0T26DRAFT_856727 [Lasiosphaeria miniovina]
MHFIDLLAIAAALVLAVPALAQDNSTATVQGIVDQNRDNRTALRDIAAPAWVASPETRGTLAILWSCLVTLVACIYTALHLNIPNRFLHKAKWTVIALFAPELVLYIALDQFFQARRFLRDMKELLQERGYREGDLDESTYSLKFCFFAVMGGFQVSIEDIYRSRGTVGKWVKPPDMLLSLSTLGILQLARTSHFVTISEAEIDDKSKANIIQKFLVVIQVTWMAVQCAFRAAWGLPISLLEIHTLVHVVCTLAMYIF